MLQEPDLARGPTDSADVRRRNLALVAATVLDGGPLSRSEIAARTGLVPASVTSLVAALTKAGLIRKASPPTSGELGRGRPTQPLEFDGSGYAVVVARITQDLETVVLDLAEREFFRLRSSLPTLGTSPDSIADLIADAVHDVRSHLGKMGVELAHLALVVPGPVAVGTGTVFGTVDLDWFDVDIDIGALVAARSRIPIGSVSVHNDASAAASAEWDAQRAGRIEPPRSMMYVKSDTGIGGAVLVDGRPFVGNTGIGFLIGHMTAEVDGRLCTCGRRGCLVTVAGPDEVLGAAGLGAVRRRDGHRAAIAELQRLIDLDDPAAVDAVRAAGARLGPTLQAAADVAEPAVIVLGGYWASVFEPLFAGIASVWDSGTATAFGQKLRSVPLRSLIVPSPLGDDAAVQGAARMSILELLRDPMSIRHAAGPSATLSLRS